MRVVLFHDEVGDSASPDERDVLVQMDAIGAALGELGHEAVRVPCTLNLAAAKERIEAAGPDIVFNLVESIAGQGRLIYLGPALLETLRVPFTGCPAAAVFTTSGKPLTKALLDGAGIDTPRWFTLDQLEAGAQIEPRRYILKSSWEHASRGLDDSSIVEGQTSGQLAAFLRERLPALANDGFAERFVDGREFNLSLLCGELLPPAEILFEAFPAGKPRIVGYQAKWDESSPEYTHTPRRFTFDASEGPLLTELGRIAKSTWRLFSLRGYARVDFRVDDRGRPWVLEVNSNPCLSPDAGFAAAVAQSGMTYTAAIERIINDALAPR
jgi:D-alanine-D-alanine ligase